MKIISFLHIYSLLFAGIFLAGCKYDTDISNPGDYVKIYMPQAAEAPAKRTFTMADTAQTIVFGAVYGGVDYPAHDIEVKFKADESLAAEFNANNGTDYPVLPANSFELEKTSGIIKKGTLKTEPLKIKVKTKGFLEPFKQYLLPVTIEQAGAELKVNEDLRTAYFLVESQREGISLKIMSYGIKSGTVDMNAVAEIINAQAPDFVVVRELDSNTTRSGNKDLPKILSELIGMPYYIYADAQAHQGGKYGTAVYSKYPIEQSKRYQLYANVTEQGPLGILTVKINDNTKITLAGTHLNSNEARRAGQTTELLNIMGNYTQYPVILAGNFNDKPVTGNTYTALADQFSFPCTTCPPNFTKANPTTNSDMVMFKPADRFRVLSHTVGTVSTSDHLPVITQLQLFYE